MTAMRALLVAQSPVLRIGLANLLRASFSSETVAEAGSAIDAMRAVGTSSPTLIVVQDALPGVLGIVACQMLRELAPEAKIVLLSDQIDDNHVLMAMQSGANALLLSTVDSAAFIAVVIQLLSGRNAMDHYLAEKPNLNDLVCDAVRTGRVTSEWADTPMRRVAGGLSAKEIAVLDGMVRALTYREIADRIHQSEQVIRAISSSIIYKLGAVDRTTAVVRAIKAGIVDLDVLLPVPHGGIEDSSAPQF